MKYTTKTAIEIMTEEDRLEVIPFLESLGGENIDQLWRFKDAKIGEIWFIKNGGELNYITYKEHEDLSDYTILKGVPKDWREESETTEQYISKTDEQLIEQILESGDMFDTFHTRDINRILSENKELRELLSDYIDLSEMYCKISESNYTIQVENITTKAKQLLEK